MTRYCLSYFANYRILHQRFCDLNMQTLIHLVEAALSKGALHEDGVYKQCYLFLNIILLYLTNKWTIK